MLLFPALLHAAESTSYAPQIRQYVDEDKVYLLENIRQKVTRPSEQTVIEALLSEDGPQSISLYKKQLREYPDPAVDPLSSSRIAAYNLALESSAPLPGRSVPSTSPKLITLAVQDSTKQSAAPQIRTTSPSRPQPAAADDTTKQAAAPRPKTASVSATLKQEKNITGPETCTLQFGSFSNRENAETLAKQISGYAPAEIILHGGMHKVQLKRNYASNEDAAAAAKKLPFSSIVVPVR
jgi:septal ring-binding cell division protein DamX